MGKTKFTKTRPVKGESRTEYDEAKERCNLTLTPTAIVSLDRIATLKGISRSELVEQFARSGGQSKSTEAIAALERLASAIGISRDELANRILAAEDVLKELRSF